MFKYFLISMSLIIGTPVSADALINTDETSQTYLLTAPGTLSGVTKKQDQPAVGTGQRKPVAKSAQPSQQNNHPPRRAYNAPNNLRFPRYNQFREPYNPWAQYEPEPQGPIAPPYPGVSSGQWGSKRMPPPTRRDYNTQSFNFNPDFNSGFGQFYEPYGFRQSYPYGNYRDTNPAAGFPMMNGVMPGLGGGNYGYPFSSFGMF